MTAATTNKPAAKKKVINKNQSLSSNQDRYTSAKLIENLGSSNDGIQFHFAGNLRTTYGRD